MRPPQRSLTPCEATFKRRAADPFLSLLPANQGVRKAAFHVDRLPFSFPAKIVLPQPLRQIRRFPLELLGHLQPVATRGNPLHAVLIEGVGGKIGADNAKPRLSQQVADAFGGMKAKIFSVGAAKDLIDP